MLRRELQGNFTEAITADATNIEINLGEELAAYPPDGSICELWAKVYLLDETDGSLHEILNVRRR
jgi:hypothetical protein